MIPIICMSGIICILIILGNHDNLQNHSGQKYATFLSLSLSYSLLLSFNPSLSLLLSFTLSYSLLVSLTLSYCLLLSLIFGCNL